MKRISIIFFALGLFLSGCDLGEISKDAPNAQQVFSNEDGLEKYINSFYDMITSASDITHADQLSDYTSGQNVEDLMRPGVLNSRTVDRWDWEDLRNINYFLQEN